jgi:hypothetical protein
MRRKASLSGIDRGGSLKVGACAGLRLFVVSVNSWLDCGRLVAVRRKVIASAIRPRGGDLRLL